MFEVIKKDDSVLYINDKLNLKIKAVQKDDLYNVYIDLNGFNPVFSMLIGGFSEECEMSGISFNIRKTEGIKSRNADICEISVNDLEAFTKEVYCFIIENKVTEKLSEADISVHEF